MPLPHFGGFGLGYQTCINCRIIFQQKNVDKLITNDNTYDTALCDKCYTNLQRKLKIEKLNEKR